MSFWDMVLAFCVALTVVVGGGTAAVKMIRPIRAAVRKVGQFLDDWNGEPGDDTHPERPGMLKRVSTIEAGQREMQERVERIEAQLHPNGGNSLRDRVDALAAGKALATAKEGQQ